MMASSTSYLDIQKMNQILDKHTDSLLSMIRIDPRFVALLVKHGAIPSAKSETVLAYQLPDDAKMYLFNTIKSKLEYFISFCIVLHEEMKRDDIVRDTFRLEIFYLKCQKREIEENRKREEEENKRLEEQKKFDQPQTSDKPDTTEEIMRLEDLKILNQPRRRDKPLTNDRCDAACADPPDASYKPLTYDDVTQLLIDHKTQFYKRFDPTDWVLAGLRKGKVITADTESKLKAAGITPDEKKNTILETVAKRGVRVFLDFCLVLCHEDILQDDLVTEVLGLNIADIRTQRANFI